jgi:hypothetical protein
MSKLDSIVSQINTDLKAGNFSSNRFQRGKFYGIAELVKIEEGTFPGIIDNTGNIQKVAIDDNYSFQLYHRITSIQAEEDELSYGDGYEIIETADMRLVIVCNREIIQLKKEDIVSGVFASMPTGISNALETSLNIDFCDITYGTFDIDQQTVYDAEYQLEDFELKPQIIMIALPYQIVTKYRKGCVNICN